MFEPATKRRSDAATKGRGRGQGRCARLACLAALVVLAPLAGDAAAGAAATATGYDLQPQRINIQSLRNGVLNYFGADRQYRSDPVNQFLRLRLLHDPEQVASTDQNGADPWLIELTDGQRFGGSILDGAFAGGQVLKWRHAQLGEISAGLDRLSSIGPADQRQRQPTPTTDRVTLANGDVLAGFVTEITDTGFNLKLHAAEQTVPITIDRLLRLDLANPPAPAEPPTDMLYLTDGSRLRARDVTLVEDTIAFTPIGWAEGKTFELPLASLERIEVAAAGVKLVDLAALPLTIVSGGEVFAMPWPQRAVGADLFLHAPISLRYDLPPGTRHFAATAIIDARPSDRRQWTDFVVIIAVDGQTVASHPLNAARPAVPINLPVTGATLTISLDAGANGPVMDRLRLIEPVLLISDAPSAEASEH